MFLGSFLSHSDIDLTLSLSKRAFHVSQLKTKLQEIEFRVLFEACIKTIPSDTLTQKNIPGIQAQAIELLAIY